MWKQINTLAIVIAMLTVVFAGVAVANQFKFTNLKCFSHNQSALQFPYCRLRVKQRNLISLSVEANFPELPITRLVLNLEMHKKTISYQPYLYNATVDICKLEANANRYPMTKMLTSIFLNRLKFDGCPINQSLSIRDLTIDTNHFGYFPMPPGDYMTKTTMILTGRASGFVSVYYSLVE